MKYEITKRQSRLWSRIGSRASFGQAMLLLAESEDNLIAMSADLSRSSGFGPLINKFPEKFVNIGIAEQNMIGVAAGFTKIGYNVYTTSFAPFLSYRASEMIRMNLSYMEMPVKIVGLASGLALSFLGNSHFGLEDISIFRTFPNIDIFSPCDCAEIFKIIELTSKLNKPSYIRLTGGVNFPIVHEEDYKLEYGKFNNIYTVGDDVHFYATGSMVYHSIQAAKLLNDSGIKSSVFNVHTIRPFDIESFNKNLKIKPKLIVSVEEHFKDGGFGSYIFEIMNNCGFNLPFLKIGLPHKYLDSGEYTYLIEKYGLDYNSIFKTVLKKLSD